MAKKGPGPGRPKVSQDKKFTRRHVVNLTPEMEAAVQKFCERQGIYRLTDGIRALIDFKLKDEGIL